MDQDSLFIQSLYLATKENLTEPELLTGYIESRFRPGSFLFYLLELNITYPNSKVLKKILDAMETANEEEITDENFEKVLQSINKSLSGLAESGESSWLGNLNGVIGLVYDSKILISQTGNIDGYIFRRKKISSITEKPSIEDGNHPIKTFADITSGELQLGDKIIFGNLPLFAFISLDYIRQAVLAANPDAAIIDLANYLRKNHAFDMNMIFIDARENNTDEIEETVPSQIIFLDEPVESTADKFRKTAVPVMVTIGERIKKISIALFDHSKVIARTGHAKWRSTYGPKTKELLTRGGVGVAGLVKEARNKIEPAVGKLPGSESFRHFKIKTSTYSKKPRATWQIYLANIFSLFGQIKVLFYKENRKFLYIILIVIALGIGYYKIKQNNDKRSEAAQQLALQNSYDQALSLYNTYKDNSALGKSVSTDSLSQALTLAIQAKAVAGNADKATALVKNINALIDPLSKTTRSYSSSLLSIANNLAAVTVSGATFYAITTDGKIYTADSRDKSSSLIASIGKDKGTAKDIYYSDGLSKLLILTDAPAVLAMDPTSKTVESLAITDAGSVWEQANSIVTFSTNIYLLDPTVGTIWKHTSSATGYNKGTAYSDKKASLKDALGLAIDGNVFVLKNDGTVVKYIKGAYDPTFTLKNIPKPDSTIVTPAQLFTSADTNSIFVLDKGRSRIVKFDKTGNFQAQYIFDGVSIDNFVVNPQSQKIWGVSAGQIYEGSL